MVIIETQEDWWGALKNNWEDLLLIFQRFLPVSEPINWNEEIIFPKTMLMDIVLAKDNQDEEILLHYLNAAWRGAPDKPSIHSIPAWDILCDLCSEIWVFDERGKEDVARRNYQAYG